MTTRAEDGMSRATMRRVMFGLPRFGPWTSNLCIGTLAIIAAAIAETLRNTLDIIPKDMEIEIVMIEVMMIEAVEIVDTRHNGLMRTNQFQIDAQCHSE
jgi:hypothetical protein